MKQIIKEKIDIEYVHEITKELSLLGCDNGEFGFRVSGSTGEWHASNRIEKEMKQIGLHNVTVEKFPVHSWEFLSGKLKIDDIEMPMTSYCGCKGTTDEGLTGEVVFIGKGSALEYGSINVKDKIVFVTFDILNDFWISLPAFEAELRGAKGIIISYEGEMYGTKEDAVNCFDSQYKCSMPVGNISRKNAKILKNKLSEGPVEATMHLNIQVDFEGKSSNVIGYIPGEDDKMILLAGHMDGYFHSYQDDLLGVGLILGIAKAMIESEFKPKHTIVFTAHGSEEYGYTESRYDWCIGSWYNINRLHPDWYGKMIAIFNIDAIRPGTPVYNIASTPEYHGFFKEFMKDMEVPLSSWPEGKGLLGLNGPWSDDFNYAICGIPGIICGRGPAEWSYQNYHTQFDDYTIFEHEKEIVEYVAENYVDMVTEFDKFILPPFNFKYALEGLTNDLSDEFGDTVNILKTKENAIKNLSDNLFDSLKGYTSHDEVAVKANRTKLLDVYRLIERDLYKLSPWDDVIFGHAQIVTNIIKINNSLMYIKDGDLKKALQALWEVDLFRVSYQFSPETYKWLLNLQDCNRSDLFWATGKLHKFLDTLSIAEALKAGNSAELISELTKALAFEHNLLEEILNHEVEILNQIEEKLKSINL